VHGDAGELSNQFESILYLAVLPDIFAPFLYDLHDFDLKASTFRIILVYSSYSEDFETAAISQTHCLETEDTKYLDHGIQRVYRPDSGARAQPESYVTTI
jgi:hypothetical protein